MLTAAPPHPMSLPRAAQFASNATFIPERYCPGGNTVALCGLLLSPRLSGQIPVAIWTNGSFNLHNPRAIRASMIAHRDEIGCRWQEPDNKKGENRRAEQREQEPQSAIVPPPLGEIFNHGTKKNPDQGDSDRDHQRIHGAPPRTWPLRRAPVLLSMICSPRTSSNDCCHTAR